MNIQNENFCEQVRHFLPQMIGKQFTVKDLTRQLMPEYIGLPEKMRERVEVKVLEELTRCRAKDDKLKTRRGKYPKAKSKHAYYMNDLGISLKAISYKSCNSEGGRRPALKFTVEPLSNNLTSFYETETTSLDNVSYEAFLNRMPRGVIIDYVFNNIMKDATQ